MAQALRLNPAGLYPDANPYSRAPQGAMSIASNVVMRAPGVLEPRPGFNVLSQSTRPGAATECIVPFDSGLVLFNLSGATWTCQTASAYASISGMIAPPSGYQSYRPRTTGARNNLYYASSTGIRKITGVGATAWSAAGVECLGGFSEVLGAGKASANNMYVAYRTVMRQTDANDYIRRSSPSPRVVYKNTSGGAADLYVYVPLASTHAAGDYIELYRTRASATAPDEEYFFAQAYKITSSDVANGFARFSDSSEDTDLGASLYTNSSQDGILQGNEVPPLAYDVAWFKNHMFYANTKQRHRITVYLNSAETTHHTFGISTRTIAGNTTNGNFTATGFPNTTGVAIGQRIVHANFPSTSRVASFTANTVTSTVAATVTGAANVEFQDVLKINSTEFFAATATSVPNKTFKTSFTAGTTFENTRDAALQFQWVVNRSGLGVKVSAIDTGTLPIALVLEEIGVGGSAFTFSSTKLGTETSFINYPAFVPAVSSLETSSNNARSDQLFWSKIDEPEAVPIVNNAYVGDPDGYIQRIVATRDALWIFKYDGVYRLSGEAGDWSIDPMDMSQRLLGPDTLTVLNERVFGLFSGGVFAISDSGAESVSYPAIDSTLRRMTAAAAPSGGGSSSFGFANPFHQEYVLGLRSGSTYTVDELLVYNIRTGAWVTWAMNAYHGCFDPWERKMYMSQLVPTTLGSLDFNLTKERRVASSYVDNSDRHWTLTITKSGNAITLSVTNYLPEVGDVLTNNNSSLAIITAVTDATHVTVDDGSVLSNGAATAYEFFTSDMEFLAEDADNPGVAKLFRDAVWDFDDFRDVVATSFSFTSDVSSTAATTAITHTRQPSETGAGLQPARMTPVRVFAPREHARCVVLRPRLTIAQATSKWRLSGLSLMYSQAGERVRRSA